MHFDKVLVPVDFSDDSLEALRYMAQAGRFDGSEVSLLHIVTSWTIPEEPFQELLMPANLRALKDDLLKEARTRMQELLEVSPLSKPPTCEVLYSPGSIGEAVSTFAANGKFSLIVIPTRGHGRVGGLLLGSVTQRVIQLSPCPILVIPTHRP